MEKIWDIFDEEKEKKEEKKKSSIWDVFEPTTALAEPIQFGMGAKAEMEITLPEPAITPLTKLSPREEYRFQQTYKKMATKIGLSLDPDDPRHFYDWRALYKKDPTLTPDETGHFSSKYKLEGHKRMYINGVKTKEEEKTGVINRMRGIGKPPEEYEIESPFKRLLESKKFQDPKLMKLHKINFESFRLWFKELKESKDKVAFLKGEGQSPELQELRREYNELAPYMYEKSEQWIENVSMIAVGIGMAWQLVNAVVTSGFKVKDKVFKAKELKEVLGRARAAYDFETGKFKATLSDNDFTVIKQLNHFLKTTKGSPVAREMLEKIVEKTGGLSFSQQVNIFGGKLYAGVPIDEMVKSIVSAGKLTQDIANQLKVMNPTDTGLVFQQLSMASPAIASKLASQFVELMPQKITKIPKVEEEMTPEEAERFEKLKEAKIIPEEEVEPTKVELEEIEKVPTPKEKFMAKIEEVRKAKELRPLKNLNEENFKRYISGQEQTETQELFKMKDKNAGEIFDWAKNDAVRLEAIIRVTAPTAWKGELKISEFLNKSAEFAEKTPGKWVTKEYRKLAIEEHSKLLKDEVKKVLDIKPTKEVITEEPLMRDDYKLIDKWIQQELPKQKAIDESHKLKMVSQQIREGKVPKDVLEAMHRQFEPTKDQETGENLWWNDVIDDPTAYPRTGTLMDFYNAYENLDIIEPKVEVKPEIKPIRTYNLKKDLTTGQKIKGNKLIGQIHKIVNSKGLTKVEFTALKRKYGLSPHLATSTRMMTVPQLEAVLKAVNRARPKIVEHKHVITPKTEKKIQSLKENLIDKLQISEEKYQEVLKDVGVYKEPKYIDGKHFITETQGKDIIYRLIDEANILRSTMPYDKAVEKNPVIKKIVDREKATISRDRDRSMKDPKEWNSMRVFAQKMEEITNAHIYRLYESLIDISLENKEKLGLFIRDFHKFKEILGDEKALKRVTAYIGSKSNLKDKPAYPKDITSEEVKLAKKIENMLIDYRARARTEKFLDNVDHPEDMSQYLQYKKEMNKAKDIYESRGYDDLVKYMKTQVWGIIKNGYDPDQVWSPRIRLYKPAPQTFGKHNIKARTDIEYKEQDKNIIERLLTYKRSMDNLVEMRPKVKALITLVDQNLDKFSDPKRVQEVIEIFIRELKGYNKPEGLIERTLNRVYAQAMQTIIMPSPVMFGRNCLQNLAFGYDKTIIIDPRNKKLSEGRRKFLETYISQIQAMKVDWFMIGEKPLPGLAWLTKMVNKVGIYPYSDQGNRHWGFWAKTNQIDRAFKGIDANSTEKQLAKAMRGAKFDDIERTERIMALEILAKDGYEAMARYVARCYVADTEFQYNRAERSPMEMGRGKWLSNLMLFPRSFWELLLKMGNKFKKGGIGQKARAFKVLVSIIVGGLIVGEGYKKVTGRRQNPYDPLRLLAYEPGGLALGTVEAFYDVIGNTIMAINGDERAAGALATAIPRLSDMMIPFYDYTLRAIEATVPMTYRGEHVNKRIDVLALRVLRGLATDRMRELGWNVKGYKPNARGYHVERNFYQKLQYIIAGAGVDVGIKEEEKKRKAIPKSEIWGEVEKEIKSDVWGIFETEEKSSVWDEF